MQADRGGRGGEVDRAELVAIGMRLVWHWARTISRRLHHVDRSDLESAGHETVARIVDSFDPALGEFVNYASVAVRCSMIDEVRRLWGRRFDRTFDAFHEERHPARISSPHEDLERREDARRLHAALALLPPRQAALVRLVYFDGLTLSEAAARRGRSKSVGCRDHGAALARLARALQRDAAPTSAYKSATPEP